MNDSPHTDPAAEALPAPETVDTDAATRPEPAPRQRGHSPVAVLGATGFLLVAAALFYLWWLVQQIAVPSGVDPARIAALEGKIGTFQQRSFQLEQRLGQLERHVTTPVPASAPVDLRPLEARIAAVEQRQAAATVPNGEIDTLTQRLAQADAQIRAADDHIARLQLVQIADAALTGGLPLGSIANAPPALARFATASPPTLAGLRLEFAEAAHRAIVASQPDLRQDSLGARMWHRIESLVTVREGNKVIVGTPAVTVLASAKARLDVGDLAGCVAALDALDSVAKAAMAEWRGQAQSLLDAHAALAALARG